MKAMLRFVCAVWIALVCGSAFAAVKCGTGQVNLNPAASAITVQGVPSAGTPVYTGTASFIWLCSALTPPSSTDTYSINIGNVAQNLGMSGLQIVVAGTPAWTAVPGVVVTTGLPGNCAYSLAGASQVGATSSSQAITIDYNAVNGACGVIATVPIQIVSQGTYPSGALNLNGLTNGAVIANSTTPVVDHFGCTVAVTNTTLALPTISSTALKAAGQTAAPQPLSLGFTGCTPNGGLAGTGFTATETWTYTPVGASSYIANTAASPASNVYVQLLDASHNPIANGGTTSFSVPQVGGTIGQGFYAQYVSTGPAGPGNVLGVATFNMTYN